MSKPLESVKAEKEAQRNAQYKEMLSIDAKIEALSLQNGELIKKYATHDTKGKEEADRQALVLARTSMELHQRKLKLQQAYFADSDDDEDEDPVLSNLLQSFNIGMANVIKAAESATAEPEKPKPNK